MSLALPSGWVDLGVTMSVVVSGTVELQMSSANHAYFGDWHAQTYTPGGGPSGGPATREELWVSGLGVTNHKVQEDLTVFPPTPAPVQMSTPLAYTETFGPYRLGLSFGKIDAATNYPEFPRHYKLRYAWFADRDTARTSTFGADTQTPEWWGPLGNWTAPQPAAFTPDLIDTLPVLRFACYGSNVTAGTMLVRFTDLTVNGQVVDTSELNDGFLVGTGGGDATATSPASTSGPTLYDIAVPYLFAYDLATSKWGVSELNAHLTDLFMTRVELHADGTQLTPYAAYLETPYTTTQTIFNLPWTSHLKTFDGAVSFLVDSGWAAAQDPPLPSDDLYVPCGQVVLPAGGGQRSYTPVTVDIATELDVNRPDGAFPAPSDWESFDTSLITVTEAAASTTFTVSGTGGSVFRTFAGDWRDRVGLGSLGKADPLFGVEEYRRLKHRTGEDLWAWPLYAYLRLEFTAPGSGGLTLTVAGAHLQVTDPHTTGSDRVTGYSVEEVPYTYTYSIATAAGANAVWVDLLFPNQGGPAYLTRIDSLSLSGFAVGSYQFTKIALKWRGTESAYLKHGWGRQVQRSDYSAFHMALDGAFPFGNFEEPSYKLDETGDYGGGMRMYSILTGATTGIVQDAQLSLQAYWEQLNLIDGLTVTWDDADSDAALSDAYGSKLVDPEPAQFADFVTDRRQTPGISWQPVCSLWAGRVELVPGYLVTVYVDHPKWGALEALVVDSGGRAGGSVGIDAVRTDTSAVVAMGDNTDTLGFVVVQPVPSGNATTSFRLEET